MWIFNYACLTLSTLLLMAPKVSIYVIISKVKSVLIICVTIVLRILQWQWWEGSVGMGIEGGCPHMIFGYQIRTLRKSLMSNFWRQCVLQVHPIELQGHRSQKSDAQGCWNDWNKENGNEKKDTGGKQSQYQRRFPTRQLHLSECDWLN